MEASVRATLSAALLQSIRRPGTWALATLGFSLGPLLWVLRNAGGIGLQESEAQGWALELAQIGAWAGACAGLAWIQTHRAWLEQWTPAARWRCEWALLTLASVSLSALSSSFLLTQSTFDAPPPAVAAIGATLLLGLHAGSLACALLRLPLPGPWRIPAFLALSLGAAALDTVSPALQQLSQIVRPEPAIEPASLLATGLAALTWGLLAGALPGLPRRR
ncbi:MAG: hypothetical protein ACYS26_21085 [Planctomycetota bacterium]|jgi:hypothetical protein